MKHINNIFVAVMMIVVSIATHAQNNNNNNNNNNKKENNKNLWSVSLGANAIDTRTSAGGGTNVFNEHLSDAFNVQGNWNAIPSVSYLGFSREVGSSFILGITGSVNKITRYVTLSPSSPGGYAVKNPGDLMYYSVDSKVAYSFKKAIKSKYVEPFMSLGVGYSFLNKSTYLTTNPGLGVVFWLYEVVGLEISSVYKKSYGQREIAGAVNAPSLFQHSLGLVFKLEGRDSDKDGIIDRDDTCPKIPGLKKYNGCPDTDGDSVVDLSDDCPDVAGLLALNGCPDSDGDGIHDFKDECPKIFGFASSKGCPDYDKDGVGDGEDKCPREPGVKANMGCPWADSDSDGINDNEDDCPQQFGSRVNKGCPEVPVEILKTVNTKSNSIYFNFGEVTFKTNEEFLKIEAISNLLKEYPDSKFTIEGHTDSDGTREYNQNLSIRRANVVKNALIERGMKSGNLKAIGFGEDRPVVPNDTEEGKAINRRTEIILQHKE